MVSKTIMQPFYVLLICIDRVVEEYTSKLVNNELEGVVLVFNGGQIFKVNL